MILDPAETELGAFRRPPARRDDRGRRRGRPQPYNRATLQRLTKAAVGDSNRELDAELLRRQAQREVFDLEVLRQPWRDPLYWTGMLSNATVFLLVRDDLRLPERPAPGDGAGASPAVSRRPGALGARRVRPGGGLRRADRARRRPDPGGGPLLPRGLRRRRRRAVARAVSVDGRGGNRGGDRPRRAGGVSRRSRTARHRLATPRRALCGKLPAHYRNRRAGRGGAGSGRGRPRRQGAGDRRLRPRRLAAHLPGLRPPGLGPGGDPEAVRPAGGGPGTDHRTNSSPNIAPWSNAPWSSCASARSSPCPNRSACGSAARRPTSSARASAASIPPGHTPPRGRPCSSCRRPPTRPPRSRSRRSSATSTTTSTS